MDEEVKALKMRIEQLENEKKEIAGFYINMLIQNIELMDAYMPGWRLEARDSIDTLKSLLNSNNS